MKHDFIYPVVIDELRSVCLRHISGQECADKMQHTVQQSEAAILALEEKDIRNFLTHIEGKLELIKFTVDTKNQLAETRKVAQEVLTWLSERQANGV
jgi:hypothetical protein